MRCPISHFALLLIAMSAPVLAQPGPDAPPPVPDVRPPALEVIDDTVQPQVTILKRGEETVEEYRINGRLYKVVVTPAHGVPYTLVDPKGDGTLIPIDQSGTPTISVPMWEIGTF